MLTTDRLTLRPLRPDDAPWIAREIANPDVQCWLTSPPHPYRLQDAEDFIALKQDDPWYLVIEVQGQPCGVVSVETGSDRPELGYWLWVSAHGHGYMTEAAGAVVDAVFETGLQQLYSGWVDGNAASENVLTKLGFTRTGEIRQTRVNFLEADRPIIRVTLTRDQWHARRTLENKGAAG
ncbi:MAG: GNAT family N-acetyltransferase [Paracoccaceae bacterium]